MTTGIGKRNTHAAMRGCFTRYRMINFKEWLAHEESCGIMGCPGHPYPPNDTPQASAQRRFKSFKKDNKGCSGTAGPCDPQGGAAGGAGGAAPAPAAAPPSKMKKK